MRRNLLPVAVVAGALFVLTGCGSSGDSGAEDTSPSASAPAASATPQITITPAMACEAVDGVYTTLSSNSRAVIAKGVRAEATGDAATVRAALAELNPLFVSTGNTFTDTASKVADPDMKAALTQLAESAEKQASFTSFAQFRSLEAMTAAPESVLKEKCAQAGRPLTNME
ncbi:hypothetical protein [Actinomadura chokoriensis]|uniref:hypothetical protein n=1 Tax=Actinomadura chokoriensis TaxID=454156 RepID=UPI0031F74CCA